MNDAWKTTKYPWRGDGLVGGHAAYCVEPSHSLLYHCAASPTEPDTMNGLPSKAYLNDHPNHKEQA